MRATGEWGADDSPAIACESVGDIARATTVPAPNVWNQYNSTGGSGGTCKVHFCGAMLDFAANVVAVRGKKCSCAGGAAGHCEYCKI
jgi:hypothetical protein